MAGQLVNVFGDLALDANVSIGHALFMAQKIIQREDAVTVSVADAAEKFIKFGQNEDVNGTEETVWSYGGTETYATGNTIDTISSSSASDTIDVIVDGHTVTGTGVNAEFTRVIQGATLNGQNKVVLTTPLARCDRIFNDNGVELVGEVFVYEDDTIVAGVPQTPALVHNHIPQGFNQSFKCAFTTAKDEYFVVTAMTVGTGRANTTGNIQFLLEDREPGKVFRPPFGRIVVPAQQGTLRLNLDPYIIIRPNNDVRMEATASTNGMTANAQISGYILNFTP